MLIIVCGLPGSGKSSLSGSLKNKIPAVHLNSDVIRKLIFRTPQYTEEEKRRVYNEMALQAEKLLRSRKNVIVDATFYTKEYRDMFINQAKICNTRYYLIECTLSESMIRNRLKKRMEDGIAVSDADYDIYLKMKDRFEPIEGDHLVVDCSRPRKELMEEIRRFINEKRTG